MPLIINSPLGLKNDSSPCVSIFFLFLPYVFVEISFKVNQALFNSARLVDSSKRYGNGRFKITLMSIIPQK